MYVQNAIKHQDYKFSRQSSEPYIGSGVKGNNISRHIRRHTVNLSHFFETFAGEMILKLIAATFLVGILSLITILNYSNMGF
jgi:hypothetical protein